MLSTINLKCNFLLTWFVCPKTLAEPNIGCWGWADPKMLEVVWVENGFAAPNKVLVGVLLKPNALVVVVVLPKPAGFPNKDGVEVWAPKAAFCPKVGVWPKSSLFWSGCPNNEGADEVVVPNGWVPNDDCCGPNWKIICLVTLFLFIRKPNKSRDEEVVFYHNKYQLNIRFLCIDLIT